MFIKDLLYKSDSFFSFSERKKMNKSMIARMMKRITEAGNIKIKN
jgi:hypothetical protein